jgi:hypothetical protein
MNSVLSLAPIPFLCLGAVLADAKAYSQTREHDTATAHDQATVAHVTNSFHFAVHAPMARVAPLFGPNGERAWAGGHWKPQFLFPQPAHDTQGAVFTVQHGPIQSVWVNTLFDLSAGRMQYVCFFPEKFVFTVDVRLTPVDTSNTEVDVTYTRTALTPDVNQHVRELGADDAKSGPEWQGGIETALGINSQPQ